MIIGILLALCISTSVFAQELPETETFVSGGQSFTIDPRPHVSERPNLLASFQELPEEKRIAFLTYRHEMMEFVLEKLKLPKTLSIFYDLFTPFGEQMHEESVAPDYSRVRPIRSFIAGSLQTTSDLIWRSYRAVIELVDRGFSLTLLLGTGSAIHTNLFGYLGPNYIGWKKWRAAGLHFSWFVDRNTGKMYPRFRFQTEQMDPNSAGTFMPLNLSVFVRLQSVRSADGQIPDTMKGRTLIVLPVITSAENEIAGGIHLGLNVFTSPFLVGVALVYFTGDHKWWWLGTLTPWLFPIGLMENYSFLAKTWPWMFWKKPPPRSNSCEGIL